jgi:hypothetical protein
MRRLFYIRLIWMLTFIAAGSHAGFSQHGTGKFKVIGFFSAKHDLAHISFVHEANQWFAKMGAENNFTYDSTSDWNNLNKRFLAAYQVVVFLDTRPDSAPQRQAIQHYMQHGGAWLGFHFSAFALTPSAYPQNWPWYHDTFLGSGQYASNTWRPTSAILKVEDTIHPVMRGLPRTFTASPNEWYRWQHDLTTNPDIQILASIDSTSFPLGTGPKQHEIWHSGYYPVVWTNKKYRMVYCNMGHNDMDYEGGTNRQLSSSFSSNAQNKLILNALLWLGGANKRRETFR